MDLIFNILLTLVTSSIGKSLAASHERCGLQVTSNSSLPLLICNCKDHPKDMYFLVESGRDRHLESEKYLFGAYLTACGLSRLERGRVWPARRRSESI